MSGGGSENQISIERFRLKLRSVIVLLHLSICFKVVREVDNESELIRRGSGLIPPKTYLRKLTHFHVGL